MNNQLLRSLAATLALVAASATQANIVTHTGDTTGGPTYNRPVEDLGSLSAVGTAVRYDNYTFTVGLTGNYTFLTTGTFDTFSTLYTPSFAASASLTNAQIANDDLLNGLRTSGFAYTLTAGVNYSLVTTGFSNTDFGAFSTTIGGAGTIATVSSGAAATSPQIFTRSGTTTGDPLFNRPLEDLSGLSAVGIANPYDAFRFRVTTDGLYSFTTTGAFDTFDFLYSPTLDPTRPLVNSKVGNDDLVNGFTTSGFAYNLLANTDYVFLTTGFAPTDFGQFSSTIGGPGSVVPIVVSAVAEPEAGALLLAGFGMLGWSTRRRKRTAT